VSEGEEANTVELVMSPNVLPTVVEALQQASFEIIQADPVWLPETHQTLNPESYEKFVTLYEALEDLDDVQSVFANAIEVEL
jgi:transcriptional/translational regulatory protein YebC/TACO1